MMIRNHEAENTIRNVIINVAKEKERNICIQKLKLHGEKAGLQARAFSAIVANIMAINDNS